MTSETLYKACNDYSSIWWKKYCQIGLSDGQEVRVYWNEERWHKLYYCKADYREATVLIRDSETGEIIQNRAILLRSYSTVTALAFIPMAYMHDVHTCAIVRFGTFSSTSSSHFWKFVRAITERNGYTRVCLYNTYNSYDNVSMAILETTRRYPTWQYIVERKEAKAKHLFENDYEPMLRCATTCLHNNYAGRKVYR